MDALYARTFSLGNMPDEVLDRIDDFFGPLNAITISQTLHFTEFNAVTDKSGVNRYVTPTRVKCRLTFPIFSLHGEDNGLVDVRTLSLMRNVLDDAGFKHLNPFTGGRDSTEVPQTDAQMHDVFKAQRETIGRGEPVFTTWRIAGHGHLDCLVGKHAGMISNVVAHYLNLPDSQPYYTPPQPCP
jgi:hypothetical protein